MNLKEKLAGLNEKGCTLTIQRHAVLEYLYENRTHPTVEEIYYFCRKCNQVYDVDVARYPLAGKKMINGHKIEELRPYIIGTCSNCFKKKR